MEPKFHTSYVENEKLLREYTACWGRWPLVRSVLLYALAMLAVMGGLGLHYRYTAEQWAWALPRFLLIIMAFVMLLIINRVVIYPRRFAKKRLKADMDLYKEPRRSETFFYEDTWKRIDETVGKTFEYSYADIQKVICTAKTYLLCISKNVGFVVYREGFDIGNEAEFLKFIREKAPQAKIK